MEEKVTALLNFPQPQVVHQLKTFMAMINFYKRFLAHASEIQAPLLQYMKGNKRKDKTPINWTPVTLEAFAKCKKSLADATLLSHPSHGAALALMVDASDIAMGAALHQVRNNSFEPLSFYSAKFSDTQRRYSTYDRELLAAYSAIRHFRYMLEGRNFTLYTDHKPLVFAFQQKPDKASPRQLRHLDFIGQFTTDIRHISGAENVVADALSRVDAITSDPCFDFEVLATAQNGNLELNGMLNTESGLCWKKCMLPNTNHEVF